MEWNIIVVYVEKSQEPEELNKLEWSSIYIPYSKQCTYIPLSINVESISQWALNNCDFSDSFASDTQRL